MKVYHKDGRVYEGDSVDCNEMIAVGGFSKMPPEAEPVKVAAQDARPADKTLSLGKKE